MQSLVRAAVPLPASGVARQPPLVRVCSGGRAMGFYRLRDLRDDGLSVSLGVSLGTISYPVGAELVMQDPHRAFPPGTATSPPATAVENNGRVMRLAWAAPIA
jgi:hypothetical protein